MTPAGLLDKNGYPGCVDSNGNWSGADTSAILGTLASLAPFHEALHWLDKLSYLENGPPRRHPDKTKSYGQEDRFSVDQMIAVMCAAIRFRPAKFADNMIVWHSYHHYLWAWNFRDTEPMDSEWNWWADISRPSLWSLEIRYCRPWWGILAIEITDIWILFSAVKWRWFPRNRVCRNHMLTTYFAYRYCPTIASRLAYKITPWRTLIEKWRMHCEDVGEYPTAHYFEKCVK